MYQPRWAGINRRQVHLPVDFFALDPELGRWRGRVETADDGAVGEERHRVAGFEPRFEVAHHPLAVEALHLLGFQQLCCLFDQADGFGHCAVACRRYPRCVQQSAGGAGHRQSFDTSAVVGAGGGAGGVPEWWFAQASQRLVAASGRLVPVFDRMVGTGKTGGDQSSSPAAIYVDL